MPQEHRRAEKCTATATDLPAKRKAAKGNGKPTAGG
jgi:hypothetical protein